MPPFNTASMRIFNAMIDPTVKYYAWILADVDDLQV